MPKKTCQLGLRQIIPLMIEFLWCLVIPTWSPVWNKITKDMKSINTQSATLRVIHTSARMFSDLYWTSPLACLDRPSLTVSPGQFTSPVVQLAASLEKWNQSRCQGGPVWCGDLWKFIYWWLLSPRDLRISFRVEDFVKLKPHIASRPCRLALSLYNPFSGGDRSQHAPLQINTLCQQAPETLAGSKLEDQEHVMHLSCIKVQPNLFYQAVVSVNRPPFYKRESASMTFL
jgi:hypothetical protein